MQHKHRTHARMEGTCCLSLPNVCVMCFGRGGANNAKTRQRECVCIGTYNTQSASLIRDGVEGAQGVAAPAHFPPSFLRHTQAAKTRVAHSSSVDKQIEPPPESRLLENTGVRCGVFVFARVRAACSLGQLSPTASAAPGPRI